MSTIGWILAGLWIIIQIAVPVGGWWGGRRTRNRVIGWVTLLQTLIVLAMMIIWWEWRQALISIATIIVAGWVTELMGLHVGFPFGSYRYTNALKPQLNRVPLVVPLAWCMILPPAWVIAAMIVGPTIWIYPLSGLIAVAWDLFIDPQMVRWGCWKWKRTGRYLGIPFTNFVGWFITGTVISIAALPIFAFQEIVSIQPLATLFIISWVLQTIAHLFFWRMPVSGIVGGVAMGLFVVLALAIG